MPHLFGYFSDQSLCRGNARLGLRGGHGVWLSFFGVGEPVTEVFPLLEALPQQRPFIEVAVGQPGRQEQNFVLEGMVIHLSSYVKSASFWARVPETYSFLFQEA